MTFLAPILAVLSVTAFCFFALCVGKIVFKKTFPSYAKHPLLSIGSSFFIGSSLIITIWRLLAYIITQARLSLALTLIISLAICLTLEKNIFKIILRQILHILKIKYAFLILILVISLTLIVEVAPQYPNIRSTLLSLGPSTSKLYPDATTAFANIGSEHSGIHAESASFIYENNYIPVTGIDIGGTLLVSMSLFIGPNLPVFFAFLWLLASKLFFIILIYSFLKSVLHLSTKQTLYGLIFIFFGNTALSLLDVMVYMAPVFVLNYSNPFFVLTFTLLSALWLSTAPQHISEGFRKNILWIFILATACVFGIHLLILTILPILYFLTYYLLKNKFIKWKYILIFFIYILSIIYCIFTGCGLTPQKMRNPNLAISNHINNVNRPSSIVADPFTYYCVLIGGTSYMGHTYYRDYDNLHISTMQSCKHFLNGEWKTKIYGIFDFWALFESEFWTALRIYFISIIGFLAGFYVIKKYSIAETHTKLYYISLFIFIFGFLLTFLVDFDGLAGARCTLSRFSHPGSIMGIGVLVYSLPYLLRNKSKSFQSQILSYILAIACFGPMLNLSLHVINNTTSIEFWKLQRFFFTH